MAGRKGDSRRHVGHDGRDGQAGAQRRARDDEGRSAARPWHMPKRAYKEVLRRVKHEVSDDNVTMISAAVAFYLLLSLFPALLAFLLIVGLALEPGQVEQRMEELAAMLPPTAAELVGEQLRRMAQSAQAAAGFGAVLAILGALWTASSGMAGLMKGLSIVYDERPRKFLPERGVALLLTLGAIAFFGVVLFSLVAIPIILEVLGLSGAVATAVRWGRWPVLVIAALVAVAILYRFAPNRENAKWSWLSPGAVLAVALWLAGSALFSLYVSRFGSYNETYGAVGGVIVLLLWLMLTAFSVLLGAELNAELELQTARDTTTGKPAPMGERGAFAADHLANGERPSA